MTHTITTAAEFAALPVGSVVRNLSRGITAERLADGRGVMPGNPTACPWDSLWSAGSHIVVLYDPSAPAPAPSVVPEAAVEALSEWGVDEGDIAALREAAIEAVAWKLIDRTSDLADRGPSDETVQAALTDARAALPLLTAAPSVTREAVEAVIFEADNECVLEVHEVRSLASRLLARYNMTPKEDR